MTGEWKHKILNVTDAAFPELALEVFRHQYTHHGVYRAYVKAIGANAKKVESPEQIPFLPIRFFKSHEIKTGSFVAETVFESSGTTGTINSRHFIKNIAWYEQVFTKIFQQFYGDIENWCIIGLLPSYLESQWSKLKPAEPEIAEITNNTAVEKKTFLEIAKKISVLPQDKKFFNKTEKLFADRAAMIVVDKYDWAIGELWRMPP